ncbi:peptidylprolyl isomerase [Altererythrobacter arenosus]|uniref:Parvulin-like PPIase n=1 Tax=Altererythrobacter arenosus TaxID=3032592 RepID=A0ABY8FTQ4_9SPHN|nr:peptidylprolyl isomerase [Altererythrobacter sp. CAU 1644]WFL76491.1 peptidylprolyl isomerase [Altererythrobacter sp. CAU 1644]
MTRKIFSNCLASLAVMAVAATPIAAQDAAEEADPLGLPSNITILKNDNPNVRTATAIVNGHVVTGTDVDQRLALLLAANRNEPSAEELQQLRMQVLRNLIDETLQIQAAEAQEIEVSQADIDQTYARVAAQNFGQETAAMDEYLRSVGSSPASLKRQIQGEMAWQRILGRNVTPFVNVSEEEVNELLQRLEQARGTEEYRLGEIYLSANAENKQAVFQNAQRIMEQLRQGGNFVGYARQFSEASTAAVGGDLGFVRLAQLPSEMATVAREMQPGQLVGPIEIPGGFTIMYLIDKRQVLTADPRDAVLSLKQISIDFAPGTTEEQATARVETFTQGVQTMRGCGDAENVAAGIGANVVTNDQIRARALPEQLQALVLNLQVGQTTPPFGSIEEGVRVLMLCGRDDPRVEGGPTFDQLMDQLTDERVGKRAQRYLRDLRNDAYIEYN